jgi:acetyl-CoA carboxylase biotin carboxyl carrier protein
VSSDEGKKGSPSDQDLIKELATILTESGGDDAQAANVITSSNSVDQNLIRELAALLTETGLTEIEVDQNGLRVRVARGTTTVQSVGVAQPAVAAPAAASADTGSAGGDALAGAVASPMVGTAYLAPEPGAAPFVKEGDKVSEGQTLMIVEAMKTMNPIPAPRGGTVTRILVDDGQPVEFGEALLTIE